MKKCQREPHDPDRFTPPSHPGSEYLSHLVTHKTMGTEQTPAYLWIFPQQIPTVTTSTVYPQFQGIEKLLCYLPQIHPVDVTMWSCTSHCSWPWIFRNMPRHPKTRRRFMIFFLRDSKPSWLVNIKGFKEHLQEVDEFYDQACFFSPCVSSRSSYRSGHHFPHIPGTNPHFSDAQNHIVG